MVEDRDALVKLWFKKAESDFRTIENNLKSEDPPTDAVCFHAQQAIEKYLKGALVYFGKHITKTHDLVSLVTSISGHIPEVSAMEDRLDEISHYGVEVRYPDISYEPSIDEAKEAYETALQIKDIVVGKIRF